MRIFYAAGASPNAYQVSESRLWKRNLFDSLVGLGHEVVPFSRDVTWHFTRYLDYQTCPAERAAFDAYRTELQRGLVEEIECEHRRAPLDLFFSYFWNEMCDGQTIAAVRALGITTVNWFCNASYQFELIADLAPSFDWCLVPERFRLDDYRAVGARPIYCQEAANPAVYHPHDVPLEFDVTFAGQAYGNRPATIRYLHDQGIDAQVWGPGWEAVARRRQEQERAERPDPRYRGILSDDELVRLYSRSRINLGFSICGSTHKTANPIRQVRLRDFEVPMSGGFYLVERFDELGAFFREDREIVCYAGPDELCDKIRYYLAHDEQRERIRLAGLERARRDHTWRQRFAAAFKEMGL